MGHEKAQRLKILLGPSCSVLHTLRFLEAITLSITTPVNAIDSEGHPIDGKPSGRIKEKLLLISIKTGHERRENRKKRDLYSQTHA